MGHLLELGIHHLLGPLDHIVVEMLRRPIAVIKVLLGIGPLFLLVERIKGALVIEVCPLAVTTRSRRWIRASPHCVSFVTAIPAEGRSSKVRVLVLSLLSLLMALSSYVSTTSTVVTRFRFLTFETPMAWVSTLEAIDLFSAIIVKRARASGDGLLHICQQFVLVGDQFALQLQTFFQYFQLYRCR
jgi:hypothetical protein